MATAPLKRAYNFVDTDAMVVYSYSFLCRVRGLQIELLEYPHPYICDVTYIRLNGSIKGTTSPTLFSWSRPQNHTTFYDSQSEIIITHLDIPRCDAHHHD